MQTIFDAEINDGLEPILQVGGSIAYISEAKVAKIDESQKDTYKSLLSDVSDLQIDLMYLEDILASTGWNSNDDVFDPVETFKARNTPVDKQFNYMHEQDKIIGHITASKLIDLEGKELEIVKEEDVPEHFHVVSGSVVYTKFRDKDQQEKRTELIAEIVDGKWFVSMECLFPNFDYAIITASGDQRIIKRNKDTAYLTKYLRAYGGAGYINGNRIGRLLRDFSFSGKGLVTNPANKQSVILNSIANVQFKPTETIDKMEIVEMTIDQKMYDDLKAELAHSKAEVSTLKSKTEESVAKSFQVEIETLKSQIASTNEKFAVANETIENHKKLSVEKDNKIAELDKNLKEVNEAFATAKAEIENTKASVEMANRMARLSQVGVDAKEAEELVKTFATASEEMFAQVVKMRSIEKVDETVAGKLKEKEVEKEDKVVDANVESAKADKTAGLGTSTEDKTVNLRNKVSEWLAKPAKSKK